MSGPEERRSRGWPPMLWRAACRRPRRCSTRPRPARKLRRGRSGSTSPTASISGAPRIRAYRFTRLTPNLPAGFVRPTAVEFISNNGVNALLVGGLNTPLSCDASPNGCVISSQQSPITVADSDGNGNLSGWRAFGQGLPNAWIAQLAYYPAVDVLVAGAVGRGVFTLYDVTSYFPQATVLQFGLANDNSLPDASFLTDGTTLTGTSFSRPLNKYGTGTLTIAGDGHLYGGHHHQRRSAGARHRRHGRQHSRRGGVLQRCGPIRRANPAPTSCSPSIAPTSTLSTAPLRARARWSRSAAGQTILTGTSSYSGPHVWL